MHDDTTAQAAPPADLPALDAYAQTAIEAEFAGLSERAAAAGYTTLRTGSCIALTRPARSLFAANVHDAHFLLDGEGSAQ